MTFFISIFPNTGETRKNFSFSIATGIRAIAGVQFRINNRLSLLTETNYGISLLYIRRKSK